MKKLLMAAALSAAFIAGPASAEAYLGAGVGAARTDSNETSWKVYGGVQINPTFGLELGYNDLRRYRGSNIESWSLAGTGTLPLNADWSLLGKLGATSNHAHFSDAGRRTDLLLGVGVGYRISKNLGVRLEYEDFGKLSDANTGNNARGNNLGLSVKYMF